MEGHPTEQFEYRLSEDSSNLLYSKLLNWLTTNSLERKAQRAADWKQSQAVPAKAEFNPEATKGGGSETVLHWSSKVAVAGFLREHLGGGSRSGVRVGPRKSDLNHTAVFVELPLVLNDGQFVSPRSDKWPWRDAKPFVPTVGWPSYRADVAVCSDDSVLMVFECELTSVLTPDKLSKLGAVKHLQVFCKQLNDEDKEKHYRVPSTGLPFTHAPQCNAKRFAKLFPPLTVDLANKRILGCPNSDSDSDADGEPNKSKQQAAASSSSDSDSDAQTKAKAKSKTPRSKKSSSSSCSAASSDAEAPTSIKAKAAKSKANKKKKKSTQQCSSQSSSSSDSEDRKTQKGKKGGKGKSTKLAEVAKKKPSSKKMGTD